MTKSIMENFPKKLTPRDVQRSTLLQLEKTIDNAKVFVVNLPVASGKSACAITLAHWRKKASIITPTKLLVDQYKNEYSYVHVLRAKSDYYCTTFDVPMSKRPKSKKFGATCKKDVDCPGCHKYLSDLRRARVMPYLLSNYYIYLAHKLYRDTLIIDEAHNLIPTLKEINSKKLWQFKHRFPSSLRTREDVKQWVNRLPDSAFNYHFTESGDRTWAPQNNLSFLKEEINSYRPRYLISVVDDEYKGETYRCIKAVPLDISEASSVIWPSQVKKIILLSATINRKDIEQLGLSSQKIQYIEADSPIQAERRPVVIPREAASMAFKYQKQNLPSLINFIEETAAHNDEKGLIHATYSLARMLKEHNWSDELKERLIFHDSKDKAAKYNEFRSDTSGKILVASGMYEGIDLPYDAGRWQILAKVPWANHSDPATKYLMNEDPDWYLWDALKTVLQACGRICRTPEDRGVTYIYDETFKRAYRQGCEKGLMPEWFQNSVKI